MSIEIISWPLYFIANCYMNASARFFISQCHQLSFQFPWHKLCWFISACVLQCFHLWKNISGRAYLNEEMGGMLSWLLAGLWATRACQWCHKWEPLYFHEPESLDGYLSFYCVLGVVEGFWIQDILFDHLGKSKAHCSRKPEGKQSAFHLFGNERDGQEMCAYQDGEHSKQELCFLYTTRLDLICITYYIKGYIPFSRGCAPFYYWLVAGQK